MPRVVSFIVLLAVIILIGSMFFQVMVQFIVPLFLAAVLVVIFKPLHLWIAKKCGKRNRFAAAVTTFAIVLIVLIPIGGMAMKAIFEGVAIVQSHSTEDGRIDTEEIKVSVEGAIETLNNWLVKLKLPEQSSESVYNYIRQKLGDVATPLLVGGFEMLASTLLGLAIMVLTMYYFFSDGPNMAAALMKLSPMDDKYEQELLDKFSDVSRAVVVASLLSAIVQGLLAGVGYYFADIESIFFWTALTMFLAMVPFVGAAAVWAPICLYLYFYTGEVISSEMIDGQLVEQLKFPEGRPTAAIVLAAYCVTVVSMIDNLIKPLVLHGQSNLHPLLALLSVIGGIQALGPIGILVGPMLVAFLQALLNMLNKELQLLGQESDTTGTPVVFATGSASDGDPPTVATSEAAKKPQQKGKHGRKRKK